MERADISARAGYSRLLCAVAPGDGAQVIARAVSLAPAAGALMLLSVLEDAPPLSRSDSAAAARLEAVRERLEAQAHRLRARGCICCADGGPVVDTVLTHARALRADLIVIGCHRPAGLEHLLGTTARSIVERASCDVLTVHLD